MLNPLYTDGFFHLIWERSGKTHLSYISTGSTQEDPSLFNWKIVDGA